MTLGKGRAPQRDLRLVAQDAEVVDAVEGVELAEDRPVNGIDGAERLTGEIGSYVQFGLHPCELSRQGLRLCHQRSLVRGGVESLGTRW